MYNTSMYNAPISVLVRTHKRPKALRRCLDSLDRQTIKNFYITIISDYKEDNVENLAYEYPNLRFMFIHIDRPLGYPGCNLYFNQIKNFIGSDYVIFIDDNDIVIDNTYLETLENIFNIGYPVIMSRASFPGRIVPPDNLWGLSPVACYVCTLNFCVRTDIYKKANWKGAHGDFHFIKNIFNITDWKKDVYWYDQVTAQAGDYPSFGKSE